MGQDYLQYVPTYPVLQSLGLDPKANADIAVQGAKDAQAQANALSALQWQRQMAGLGQAQGFVNNLQSLYNSIYSPGGGVPAPGGQPIAPPPQSEMDKLSGNNLSQVTAPKPPTGGGKGNPAMGILNALGFGSSTPGTESVQATREGRFRQPMPNFGK